MSAEKPGFRKLVLVMTMCAVSLFLTMLLVFAGVWFYYRFVLQIPSGMDAQLLLMKALRTGASTGSLIGLGVWIHLRMEYRKSR